MGDETVAGLVKDLTTQLATIAERFSVRADTLLATTPTVTVPEGSTITAAMLARLLLSQRAERMSHFPPELFHEPAWDMLLALFVANEDGRVMNVKTLVASASAPVTTSQRWIEHLHKLNLIDRVIDPGDRRRIEVSLSDSGDRAVKSYLRALGAT